MINGKEREHLKKIIKEDVEIVGDGEMGSERGQIEEEENSLLKLGC